MARQISLIIVGAGDRGQLYADLAARDPRVRIAAVADPDERRRTTLADRHTVPSTRRYSDWRDVMEQPRIADAAVIATLDRLHHEPALALAEQGYHLLLEKPMAVTPDMPLNCRSGAGSPGHTGGVPRPSLYPIHPGATATPRLGRHRSDRVSTASRAGRLVASGALLRTRQLAAHRRVDVYVDGQECP